MSAISLIIISVVGTGISSISVQLLFLREFLSQFQGNEITISLVLFCWLIISGFGSLTSKFVNARSVTFYSAIALITAIFPLIQIVAIRILREIFFVHGKSPGFYSTFFFILALSTPYAFLIGFLLPYSLSTIRSIGGKITSGGLYITDNIGDITGGVLFSFILVYFFTPFKIIALTAVVLIIVSLMLIVHEKKLAPLLLSTPIVILFFIITINTNFELSTLFRQYSADIVNYTESPYGRIIVTKENEEYTLWESGTPIYSSFDITNAEEKVHYPLCQLDSIENVLLVSGGIGETFDEILKYSPHGIDYVELDPALIETATLTGLLHAGKKVNVILEDGRQYITNSKKKYSAIILDLPEPDTFQLNRFYTTEFFSRAKSILRKEGILSFSLDANPNYLSDIRIKKLSSIYNTVSEHFQNVLLIPGEEIYFLASNKNLTADIPLELKKHSIPTSYIDGFYHGNITEERVKFINDVINKHEPKNSDFEPRVINIMFKEWFKKHGTSPNWFIAALLSVLVLYLSLMKKEEFILFSTGFVSMGVEMLLLFSFQIVYGYLYLKIGAIITSLLLGLLPGAIIGNIYKRRGKPVLICAEAGMILLLTMYLMWTYVSQGIIQEFVFLIYGFTFSLFCGIQFPVAAEKIGEYKSPASLLFSADLIGAAFGTLLVGVLLIPFLGIHAAVIALILIKATSTALLLLGR